MQLFRDFLGNEAGAVTIEWVALSAGAVLLALGIIAIFTDPLTGIGQNIGDNVIDSTSNLIANAGSTGG